MPIAVRAPRAARMFKSICVSYVARAYLFYWPACLSVCLVVLVAIRDRFAGGKSLLALSSAQSSATWWPLRWPMCYVGKPMFVFGSCFAKLVQLKWH